MGEAQAQGFPGATAYSLAHEALASGMSVLDGVVRHSYNRPRPDRLDKALAWNPHNHGEISWLSPWY